MQLLLFQLIRFFSLFFFLNLCSGFSADTLVKTSDGYVPISQLTAGDAVLSRDVNGNFAQATVLLTTHYNSGKTCRCSTDGLSEFRIGPNQLFFNGQTNKLISPAQLTINDQCSCHCADDQVVQLYEIIVSDNHLFYVTTDDICVHNMIELSLEFLEVVGNSINFQLSETYSKLLYAGFLLAVEFYKSVPEKLYIVENTDEEKGFLLSRRDNNRDVQFYGVGALNNKDRYCSMNEFFKNTKFGRDIKNRVSKSGIFIHGVEAYRVIQKIPEYGLDKGDYIYIDRAHCDHLEVFKSNKEFKKVLNLNGTCNESKTARALGRML